MRRLTLAKIYAKLDAYLEHEEIRDNQNAQLMALLYNINRDPGDPEKGKPEAPAASYREFKLIRRKARLDSKQTGGGWDPNWDHNLMGAKADRAAFEAWSKSKEVTSGRL